MYLQLQALLIVVLLFSPQDAASTEARTLIEKLRSNKVEERDLATRKLKEMGKAAVPELQKAREDSDSEVAGRAKVLLALFALRERLSPNLRKVLPGVEERLAPGGHAWTEVLLEVVRKDDHGKTKYPDLEKEDWSDLVGPALRETRTPEEKLAIVTFVSPAGFSREILPLVASEIAKLLGEADESVRDNALWFLRSLDPKVTAPELTKLLTDGDAAVRSLAVETLGSLNAKEAIGDIAKLLDDGDARVRVSSALTLGRLGAKHTASKVAKLLTDGDSAVRRIAVQTLGGLGVM
ncbi:MAG TPA: HEAT repeat domain-containing protein, partial [Planctomycetota bacterium]|nr:HEAT repeat domain-containing protein [Planctomycetota bacterium]